MSSLVAMGVCSVVEATGRSEAAGTSLVGPSASSGKAAACSAEATDWSSAEAAIGSGVVASVSVAAGESSAGGAAATSSSTLGKRYIGDTPGSTWQPDRVCRPTEDGGAMYGLST